MTRPRDAGRGGAAVKAAPGDEIDAAVVHPTGARAVRIDGPILAKPFEGHALFVNPLPGEVGATDSPGAR